MKWIEERRRLAIERWSDVWGNTTLNEAIRDAALSTPDRLAVVDPAQDVRLSYRELDRMASAVATNLLALDVRSGDTVSAQLPNVWQFVVLYAATIRVGAVFNPLMPDYRAHELRYNLDTARAKAFVIPDVYRGHDHVAMARDIQADLDTLEHVFTVHLAGQGEAVFPSFVDLLEPPGETFDPPAGGDFGPVDPNADSLYCFTSGSEARPKLVVHTHNTADVELEPASQMWGLDGDDVYLVTAPVGHGAGFQWCLRIGLHNGGTTVLLDRWEPTQALELIDREGCTFTYAPTRFLQDLVLTAGPTPGRYRIPVFASGGAPIPRSLVIEAREVLDCQVLATYGQTETYLATATRPGDPPQKVSETDGRAMPSADVMIVDDDGNEVPRGTVGECITRNPSVALGYLNSEEATDKHFRLDGWLYTGDLCVMDEDGFIRVVGRSKEILIRNGLNLSPLEIEDTLLRMPEVREVAVIGVPEEQVGERICAIVVPEDAAAPPNLAAVAAFCQELGMAKYKTPEALIYVDQIPRSAVGKTQRNVLRATTVAGELVIAEQGW